MAREAALARMEQSVIDKNATPEQVTTATITTCFLPESDSCVMYKIFESNNF